MSAFVRSATLTHFAEIAHDCGLDARALVAEAGLPQRCLADPDLIVSAKAVSQLLELAAERGGESALGLRMAHSRRLSNLGPLSLLVREEPTLRAALEALVRHIHLHNEAMSVTVEQDGGLVLIREDMLVAGVPSVRQSVEMAVATTLRILRIFMGAQWQPHTVCFSHRAPPIKSLHSTLLNCPIRFDSEFSGIVCRASDLDARNPGADPVMIRYANRLLEAGPSHRTKTTDRVRQLIALLLPRGHCRVEAVASHLGIDRSTVARHLAAEGTNFSALVDESRRELLQRYLQDGAKPLTEVAAMLGFSEASAFSRWHRHRFGVAARIAQKQLRLAGTTGT